MRPRRAIVILAAVLACASAAAPAGAAPIAGATYTGTAADGAQVSFTISPDGTLVTSYQLVGVPGNTCSFFANGDAGAWPGAPIEDNAFTYHLRTAIALQGSFAGTRSASGTFDFHQDATSQTPACDTGLVRWTASTTANPVPGQGGGGGPGSGPGRRHHSIATRISLRRSPRKLGGRVTSPTGGCRAGRTVILWRGSRRIGSTRSKAGGSFSFARSPQLRGRPVRVSTPARTARAGACAAASSTFIKG